MRDKQHVTILNEIETRRRAALRKLAVINHLNAPQQELQKFAWLRPEKIITEEEFQTFRERIIAMLPETEWDKVSGGSSVLN